MSEMREQPEWKATQAQGRQKERWEMTVFDIVVDYLKRHGYDGLCNEECGCPLEMLGPCDGIQESCQPAYNHPRLAKANGCHVWMTPRKRGGK